MDQSVVYLLMLIKSHVIVLDSDVRPWIPSSLIPSKYSGYNSKCIKRIVKLSTFNTQTMTNNSGSTIDTAIRLPHDTEQIYLENKQMITFGY